MSECVEALKKRVEQLCVELEMAQRFHDLAVAERNYARTQTHMLKLRLEKLLERWSREELLRKNTKQAAQAALIRELMQQLRAELVESL